MTYRKLRRKRKQSSRAVDVDDAVVVFLDVGSKSLRDRITSQIGGGVCLGTNHHHTERRTLVCVVTKTRKIRTGKMIPHRVSLDDDADGERTSLWLCDRKTENRHQTTPDTRCVCVCV